MRSVVIRSFPMSASSVLRSTAHGSVRVSWLDTDEALRRLRRAAEALLRRRPEVLGVYLFGSLAEGRAVPGSDADVLVLLERSDRPPTERPLDLRSHFRDAGLPVDLFCYTPEEVLSTPFAREAVARARTLAEDPRAADVLARQAPADTLPPGGAMANRASDWLAEAERDLQHAEEARRAGRHNWACFAAQQAAEKAAKALHQHLGREARGHVVADLLEALPLDVPPDLVERAKVLDNFYIPTRYPNAHPSGAPSDHYGPIQSGDALEHAGAILGFVRSRMPGAGSAPADA